MTCFLLFSRNLSFENHRMKVLQFVQAKYMMAVTINIGYNYNRKLFLRIFSNDKFSIFLHLAFALQLIVRIDILLFNLPYLAIRFHH